MLCFGSISGSDQVPPKKIPPQKPLKPKALPQMSAMPADGSAMVEKPGVRTGLGWLLLSTPPPEPGRFGSWSEASEAGRKPASVNLDDLTQNKPTERSKEACSSSVCRWWSLVYQG